MTYCKYCGADLPLTKEPKLMTWEEFVDWAKNLNAKIEESYIKLCGCFFWKDGIITNSWGDTMAENCSYEQMKSIIEKFDLGG